MSSDPSLILDALRQIPTAETIKAEHQISLVDEESPHDDAERSGSEAATAPPTPGPSPLTHKLTHTSTLLHESVKREWTRRKYAKHSRDRYDFDSTPAPAPPDEDPSKQPQPGEPASATQASYLERSRAKAKYLLKRKRTLGQGKDEQDSVIDILYENQRGVFLFGVPKYSSSSLLPSDPRPWQNAHFRTSPVDIRNAQVPDPSWEWAWKSWYVDMSRDVDEEGWEYSFQFLGRFSWHGNHPWFHSFVRRRRWLRMRKRREPKHFTQEKAHELTAEYFTIHPKTVKPLSEMSDGELVRLEEKAIEGEHKDGVDVDVEKMEITDIGSLIQALRKAAVDREKLVAVRKFIQTGGDELYYLSPRMSEIMSLFIFQSSRRQLLADLLRRYDEISNRKDRLENHTHDNEDAQKEHQAATRHAENLMKAIHAADEEVKKLEYWSDIKTMAQRGLTLETSEGGKWDKAKWQGLSSPTSTKQEHPQDAFASKQAASEGVRALHPPPPQQPENVGVGLTVPEKEGLGVKRKGSSSVWFDAKMPANSRVEESSEDSRAYSTAAESASELGRRRKGKGKGRVSNLDGVEEGEGVEEDDGVELLGNEEESNPTPSHVEKEEEEDTPTPPRLPGLISDKQRHQTVQIIEPVPEPSSSR